MFYFVVHGRVLVLLPWEGYGGRPHGIQISAAGFSAFGSIFEPSGKGRKQEGPSHSSQANCWSQSHSLEMGRERTPFITSSVANWTSHAASETREVFPRRETRIAVIAAMEAVEKPISIWHIVLRGPMIARRCRLYMRAITLQEYYHQHAESPFNN